MSVVVTFCCDCGREEYMHNLNIADGCVGMNSSCVCLQPNVLHPVDVILCADL